jgi:fumarate reductase flavoprotein subunit
MKHLISGGDEITTIWRNVVQTFQADLAIIGAGGAGLRAAIAAAQANPNAKIALISKVYPMRSHTVAAEGGSAAVAQDHDSFDYHFHDTVAGGDWLCEQDVVDYFVHHCPTEMTQLEQWGCPWSRREDGSVNVRRFGGMKIERTWFAADKTGFHMLHTLFQTSLQFPQIQRFDEHFVLDILVDEGHARGLVAMNMMEGTLVQIRANAVVMATGGAGRVYRYNTNGGIVTGDGMGMALSHGVPLRDMEFVQYHPTGLPGSGILMTEGCRGEGGILVNKNGYRYLQDYGMGPETPLGEPKNKYMELGPRDKVSQAFWHEWRKGNTISTPRGDVVHLDLRHLGEKNCSNVYRSSANWRKPTWVSIRLKNRSRYVRPHTTPWAVSKPISTVKPALKVCSLSANVPLLVCMALTVWALTLWRNWWSSVVWPVNKLRNALQRLALQTVLLWMHRLLALKNV